MSKITHSASDTRCSTFDTETLPRNPSIPTHSESQSALYVPLGLVVAALREWHGSHPFAEGNAAADYIEHLFGGRS